MKRVRAPGVPVVDLSDGAGVFAALSTIGFVALRDHGVPKDDLVSMRKLLVELFAVDEAAKARQAITRENYRGFIPMSLFTPNRVSSEGEGPNPADSFEGYKLHWECPLGHPARKESGLYGSNLWPEHLTGMPRIVASWWASMERLAERLLDVVADELEMDRSALAEAMVAPLTNTTLLHYPARAPDDTAQGFHPHKDITVVTVLDPDPIGGLEVRTRDGRWVEAECPEGALLVNVGDVLEVWSGGRLISTPHRVIISNGAERYSAPFFVVPNHRVVAEPLIEPVADFEARSIPMGYVQSEVWRTNWPDQEPADTYSHLGGLD